VRIARRIPHFTGSFGAVRPRGAWLQWAAVSVSEYSPPLRTRDGTISRRISTDLSDLVHFRHLVWYMAMSSVAVENRGTKLGRSWWIIEPILLMCVYTLLVKVIFHQKIAHFPLVVLASIIAFEFFARSVGRSMTMLQTVQSSMLHVGFPRSVIPLAVTLSEAIRFVISVIAFIGIAMGFGIMPQAATALVIPFMAIEILFTVGAAYFFAATGVFFRDLAKITEYLFFILFQLGCGMLPLATVVAGEWVSLYSPQVRTIVLFNPFTTFFEGMRGPLLYGRFPDIPFAVVGGVAIGSVLLLIGGYVYFLRREGSFNKVVF
jgi:lipopolysaccharide transport system permease protein